MNFVKPLHAYKQCVCQVKFVNIRRYIPVNGQVLVSWCWVEWHFLEGFYVRNDVAQDIDVIFQIVLL